MKKITLIIALFVSALTIAQETITEGKMIQKVTLGSPNEQVAAQLAMIGDMTTTTYFKGNKSMAEMSNPMAGDTKSVVDMDAKKMIILMDNPMAGKMAMETSLELTPEQLEKVKVVPNNKTKTVLGYKCKGYDVVTSQQGVEMKMTMYVTEKLNILVQNTATLGNKIKGFPMYMEMHMNQMGMDMTTTMEVTEIKKEKVSDDKFDMTIPEGYQKM
jgi:hypothetical protein